MNRHFPLLLTTFFLTFVLSSEVFAVDKRLRGYKKVDGISGKLSSVGSDTLANMMTFWAEEYNRLYPNVNMQVQAAGSSTAPPALIEGTAQIGPMSRKMKSKEINAFEKRYGYKPTAVRVAIDALALFANKDNPISGLTLKQIDAVFSATRKCGGDTEIRRWGELGLTGEWTRKDIQLFGRNSVSGTYGYFKDKGLCKGDFKNRVNEQPGSASVVQSISSSLNALGYSGIGYKTSGVKTIALSKDGKNYIDATLIDTTPENYPLSRYLYVYVNKHPNKPLEPLTAELLKMILSGVGQNIVEKDGYIPLPANVADQELTKLNLF